jgi:hypothetical protein
MSSVNGYTRKQAKVALFVTKSPFEHRILGRYRLEKYMGEERGWVVMSGGDADRNARPGHELDHFTKQAKALEGRTRLRNAKTDEVVWPPENTQ